MAVMNKEQLIYFEVLEANGNAERFRKYLHGLQAAHLNAHVQDPVVIMVNVGFHHAAIVLEKLAFHSNPIGIRAYGGDLQCPRWATC